jgi:hypothetical protein
MFVALLAAAASSCAGDEGDTSQLPTTGSSQVCCDCACTDGTDVCLNVVATAELGSSCDTVCESACLEQDECSMLGDAQSCTPPTTPPPCAATVGDDTVPC